MHWLQPPPDWSPSGKPTERQPSALQPFVVRLAIVEQVGDRLLANLGAGDASGVDPCTQNATVRIVRQRFEDMKWVLEVVET